MSPVFGFNTDIRYGDTVYHVQTEAREAELTVQTTIFVRGRCIDTQQSSYAEETTAPDFSEGSVHQIVTRQHKFVVNCIREGKLASLMSMSAAALPAVQQCPSQNAIGADDADILGLVFDQTWRQPAPAPAVVADTKPEPAPVLEVVETPELMLDWLSSDLLLGGTAVKVRYRLTQGSRGVEGAKMVARFEIGGVPSAYARTVTDCEGEAEVTFALTVAAQTSDALSVTVQALYLGRSTARRFRLSRA